MPIFTMIDGLTGGDAFTKILLHMDGANAGTTFTDSNVGGSAHTWTPTSVTTSTAGSKFGTAVGLFATGQITTPDSADFTLGSGDFTVDFWVNRNGNNGTHGLFGQASSTINPVSCGGGFTPGNSLAWYMNTGFLFQTTGTITDSNWHHIAYVRNGTSCKIYIDGTADATTGAFSGATADLASNYAVGKVGDSTGASYAGYMDEFRLSVGIARWTSNFTPPTQPYAP